VFRDVVALGARLRSLGPVVGSRREKARVAIVFDYESWWVSGRDSHPTDALRYDVETLAWYRALLDLGIRADIVPVAASFDDYEVVIAPMLHVVPNALRARLEAVVADGRHLVTSYFSGIVDEHDRVWLGGYPGALRELLGVTVEEFVPLLPDAGVHLASGAVATLWTERISRVESDVDVLDTYADGDLAGQAAVTRRRVGAGSATYVSADIGRDGVRGVLARLGDDVEALRGDALAADGRLEVIVRVARDGERFVFLVNRTDETVAAGAADVSGVEVAPRSVVVLTATGALAASDRRLETASV